MSSPLSACKGLFVYSLASVIPLMAAAQTFSPLGGEYALSGNLDGDQNFAQIAITPAGGYAVWQDNRVDGSGLGIAAQRLDANYSPIFASFRVNQQILGDQERPQVAVLDNGGAAIVWQGGKPGYQNIFLRILSSLGTFTTANDIRVNSFTNSQQSAPVIAGLSGGKLLVAWSSLNQDGSMQGVFAQMLNTNGQPLGVPFQVNQFTNFNQRNPAVAVLTNGNFVITWVSENQGVSGLELTLGINRVHVYGRVFDGAAGTPKGDEFRINTLSNLCANPSIAGSADGGFIVAWSQKDLTSTDSWDVYARAFASDGTSGSDAFRVNSYTLGDQFVPRVSALGANHLIIWTSMGQDGSWEGVYGQPLAFGSPVGSEFRVNTTTVSKQFQPAVASDGAGRFLTVWSSYVGASGFDVMAQRYSAEQLLAAPSAPWVTAVYADELMVTWPKLSGFASQYEVYMDAAVPPNPTVVTADNLWVASGLGPATTHTFRLAYLAGGRRSALSTPATGRTWDRDRNGDGLPDDWQATYWGPKQSDWQPGWADSDGDGVSNFNEFLAGTDPTDANSVLRLRITHNHLGRRLLWNTRPGFIYQVEHSSNAKDWSPFGEPRLAAGTTDSVAIDGPQNSAFYRLSLIGVP